MENAAERNMIMQAVCEATTCPDARVRAAAYECIVNIAYQYYNKLRDYMPTLFQITLVFNIINNVVSGSIFQFLRSFCITIWSWDDTQYCYKKQ